MQDVVDECLMEGVFHAYAVEDDGEVVADETIACPLGHEREAHNDYKAFFVGFGIPELETQSAFTCCNHQEYPAFQDAFTSLDSRYSTSFNLLSRFHHWKSSFLELRNSSRCHTNEHQNCPFC
jgi:hypothetical protein